MTQKFTAEEVRRAVVQMRVVNLGELQVEQMLIAYADTLSKPADSGRVDANCMDVLRRLRDMLPTVGICGWPAGVSALDEAISTLAAQGHGESFQQRVSAWMAQCFLPSLYSNMTERGDRLLEEVLELLQSKGYDRTRVATLVDYVWSRPVGEPSQEVGGVMVTLAGFCWIAGLDMHAAGDIELTRIERPEVMDKIRRKQEAKNALHFDTPLPGNAPASPAGVPDDTRRLQFVLDHVPHSVLADFGVMPSNWMELLEGDAHIDDVRATIDAALTAAPSAPEGDGGAG